MSESVWMTSRLTAFDSNISGSSGCCQVCAEKCHEGHQVTLANEFAVAFCDCAERPECVSKTEI